jgi:arylsulfatase A-like enzyme
LIGSSGRPFSERCSYLLLLTLVLVLQTGCGTSCQPWVVSGPAERAPVEYDFVASLPLAEVNREVASIAFGTPAARGHLREGWSADETDPDGRSFVWSEGEESTLAFFLASVRPLTLAFQCAPSVASDSEARGVSLSLNGHALGAFKLEPRRHRYRTTLPVEAVVAGHNRLVFRYDGAGSAESAAGSSATRRRAVAWYDIRLGSAKGSPDGLPGVEGESLRIPLGTQIDYYTRLPRMEGVLTLDAVTLAPSRDARLAILIQAEGEPDVAISSAASDTRSIPLMKGAGKVARISFRAFSASGATSGFATLVRPALRGRREQGASSPPARDAPNLRPRPHVFIYLVDTLRSDHLGCYGYGRPVSPHIDAFARDASVLHGIAQSSWTKPSVASLFTGLSPPAHRAEERGDTLSPEATTLAKLLGAAGYRTLAVSSNAWVSATFGLDQGFQEFRSLLGPSDRVNQALFALLRTVRPDERLCVYAHTVDPHAPYAPPADFRARFAPARASLKAASVGLIIDLAAKKRRGESISSSLLEEMTALYDAEIASNDLQFGLFLEELKRRGLYDDSLIVFTADHGEEFFEHGGLTHGTTLYAEVLEVPFIVKWPRGIEAPVSPRGSLAQHVDLFPTILDLLGIALPPGIEGRSLLDPSRDADGDGGRESRSYLSLDGVRIQSMTEGTWKLMRHGAWDDPQPKLELYDLEKDDERTNQRDLHPLMTGYLLARLKSHAALHAAKPAPPQAALSEDLKDKLRALGYLQ